VRGAGARKIVSSPASVPRSSANLAPSSARATAEAAPAACAPPPASRPRARRRPFRARARDRPRARWPREPFDLVHAAAALEGHPPRPQARQIARQGRLGDIEPELGHALAELLLGADLLRADQLQDRFAARERLTRAHGCHALSRARHSPGPWSNVPTPLSVKSSAMIEWGVRRRARARL